MIAGDPVSQKPWTTVLRKAWLWMERAFARIGLLTVLVMVTPLVSWWAHAYSGPFEQPKGNVLILLSAVKDDKGLIPFFLLLASALCPARVANRRLQGDRGQRGRGPVHLRLPRRRGCPPTGYCRGVAVHEHSGVWSHTARIVEGMPGEKVLLTSDFHMYRAIRVFRKLGVEVTPYTHT